MKHYPFTNQDLKNSSDKYVETTHTEREKEREKERERERKRKFVFISF